MAVAYQSVQTTTWDNRSSMTITKPANLAVGDLMIVYIAAQVAYSRITMTGWTEINSGAMDTTEGWKVGYKVATADDVAATEFTFTFDSATTYCAGSIVRISGAATVFTANAKELVASSSATTTFSSLDITPLSANSLILYYLWQGGSDPISLSNYAIATSNPTWTEAYDFSSSLTAPDYELAMAYATRAETTSTGDFTVDCTDTGYKIWAFAISISEQVNASVSPAVLTVTISLNAPTITGSASVSPDPLTVQITIPAPTVSVPTPSCTNTSMSASPSITNTSKSDAPTITNVSKSDIGTITNVSKS